MINFMLERERLAKIPSENLRAALVNHMVLLQKETNSAFEECNTEAHAVLRR